MIFGLGAALSWGVADYGAAVSGRRIGSFATVVTAQVTGALIVSAIVIVSGADLSRLGGVLRWLGPNCMLTASAYLSLYRGLELGPIAVVSPLLASYAVVPVFLAVALLGESLTPIVGAGIVVTILGAVLTSTDLRALRAGTRRSPTGLRWAAASAVLFGLSTYVLGWASQRAGWLPALWLSRTSTTALLLILAGAATARRPRTGERTLSARRALTAAATVGLIDLAGAVLYARGAELGLISIVTAASATYPLIPVTAGLVFLRERPAPNQLFGVLLVVGGLLAVGLR